MVARDYYRVMGLALDASEEDIKRAYRRLAMEYHPDRNMDDPESLEKLKEINEAYHVLGNRERKKAYDKLVQSRIRNYQFKEDVFVPTDLEALIRAFSTGNLKSGGRASCMKRGFGKRRCKEWRRSRFP